jgi:hypothetical protein
MAAEYNQYQPSTSTSLRSHRIALAALSLLLLLFVGLSMWYCDFKAPKYYCTERHLRGDFQESGCVPCPADSTCLNGAVVECHREKVLMQGECIENNSEAVLQKRMRVYLANYLAEQKGNARCGYSSENSDRIKLSQLDSVLRPQFGRNYSFPIALSNLKEELRNGPHDFPEHISVSSGVTLYDDSQVELASDAIKRPFFCRLNTALEQHPWPLFFLIIGIIYNVLRVQNDTESLDDIKRAENLYKCLLAMIGVERKVRASELSEFLPEGLSLKRRERILQLVRDILIADKQLSLVFENNETYYMAY